MSTSQTPIGEGEFVAPRKTHPSFWSRLAKQKQGLGLMALSASCGFLALSLIRQQKEVDQVNEMASLLRSQNDALKERLENVKSAVQEEEGGVGRLGPRLKELLQIKDRTIPLPDDPKEEMRNEMKKAIKSKFMV